MLHKINYNKKSFIIYLCISILVLLLVTFFLRTYFKDNYYLGLNFTPSLHEKVFLISKNSDLSNLHNNDLIGFKYQGPEYAIYKKGDYFIKYIVCKEGDFLEISDMKSTCNNEPLYGVALKKDSLGNKLPQFHFKGIIPKDKFYVWTPYVKSFDSRYWGFVDKKDIVGTPIWKF